MQSLDFLKNSPRIHRPMTQVYLDLQWITLAEAARGPSTPELLDQLRVRPVEDPFISIQRSKTNLIGRKLRRVPGTRQPLLLGKSQRCSRNVVEKYLGVAL